MEQKYDEKEAKIEEFWNKISISHIAPIKEVYKHLTPLKEVYKSIREHHFLVITGDHCSGKTSLIKWILAEDNDDARQLLSNRHQISNKIIIFHLNEQHRNEEIINLQMKNFIGENELQILPIKHKFLERISLIRFPNINTKERAKLLTLFLKTNLAYCIYLRDMTLLENVTENMLLFSDFKHEVQNIWFLWTKKDRFESLMKEQFSENEEENDDQTFENMKKEKTEMVKKCFGNNIMETVFINLRKKEESLEFIKMISVYFSKEDQNKTKSSDENMFLFAIRHGLEQEIVAINKNKALEETLSKRLENQYHFNNLLDKLNKI